MEVPQNGGFTKENPTKMDDDWGYPYDLGNLHISISHVPSMVRLWQGKRGCLRHSIGSGVGYPEL